jgi:hypothetical protein
MYGIHIREAALRATMRNSILTHAALYRYQPAEQSYCYVRHYVCTHALLLLL